MISFAITTFVFLFYNAHFEDYSDYSQIVVNQLIGSLSDTEESQSNDLSHSIEEIIRIAKENNGTIFVKNYTASGIAIIDYGNFMKDYYGSNYNGDTSRIAIVDDNDKFNFYLSENVLFPETYKLEVIDRYNNSSNPSFVSNCFYYFSIKDLSTFEGGVYTTIQDENVLNELESIITSAGFNASRLKKPTVFEAIKANFVGNIFLQATMFTFVSVVCCLGFLTLNYFKNNAKSLRIHHLFGGTYLNLFIKETFPTMLVALLGSILGYFVCKNNLYLSKQNIYEFLAMISVFINGILALLLSIFGFVSYKKEME